MRTALSAALLFALTLGVTDARAETPQKNVPSKAEKLAALGVVNVWAAPGSVLCTPPKGDLPSVVRGIVVAEHYLIGPAKYFPAAKDLSKDPRVCLHDGRSGIAGQLVFVDYEYGMALIRFEGGLNLGIAAFPDQPGRESPFDQETAVVIKQFLRDYFASWGKYVPDQPTF